MAYSYKVLGQAMSGANANVDLYTVPASTSAIISTLNVCNQSQSNVTFRIAIRPAGVTGTSKHYIVFDSPIPAQDTIALSLGMSLGNTDVITGYSLQGNVSFAVFGTEIT
jgi:hypothetical protein